MVKKWRLHIVFMFSGFAFLFFVSQPNITDESKKYKGLKRTSNNDDYKLFKTEGQQPALFIAEEEYLETKRRLVALEKQINDLKFQRSDKYSYHTCT